MFLSSPSSGLLQIQLFKQSKLNNHCPLKSLKQKFDISPCLNIQKYGVPVEKTHLSRKWYLENIQMNLPVPSNNLNSCLGLISFMAGQKPGLLELPFHGSRKNKAPRLPSQGLIKLLSFKLSKKMSQVIHKLV